MSGRSRLRFGFAETGTTTGATFTVIGGFVEFGPGADWRKPRTPERLAAIEKARKVRALARRPGTPEEGAAATAMLAKLMADNDLSNGDLDATDLPRITITVRRHTR